MQNLLLGLPLVQQWPDLYTVLEQAAAKKYRHWTLPGQGCQAVGGCPEIAMPVAAALACLHTSILLVDDMLDADPRGVHHCLGSDKTANLAVALHAIAADIVIQSDLPATIKPAIVQTINQMMLLTSYGQHLDVQAPVSETEYWQVVRTKSVPFFSTAFRLGALVGGAPAEVIDAVEHLGADYGEMVQIHDDLNDTLTQPATSDWLLQRSPLPILFAQIVNHPERERFLHLRGKVSDPEILTEAQSILIRCGAISYCIDQILCRYRRAKYILLDTPLSNKTGLEELLTDVIAPIQRLLGKVV